MGKIKHVLFIVNPISGDLDKTEIISEVEEEVKKIDALLTIHETTGKEDLDKVENEIKKIDPCRIIVAGGDGTIKLAADALRNREIPLGILPAGSANGLAANLHLPSSREEQIRTALGDVFIEMDILRLNDESCLHMSDFGLNAELIKNYEAANIRGKLGYLLQSIPTLIKSNYPFHFEIETNNAHYKKEGLLLSIANASSYGTGATVNPNGRPDDGKFELLVFKQFDFIEILKTLRNEVELDPEFVEIISTTRAKITCQKPISFQIDGEYIGELESIEVRVSEKKLTIAVARAS